LEALTRFKPQVSIEEGVAQFALWFLAWKNKKLNMLSEMGVDL
jgi:nucleoside-diphosphate-sugar epimerase